MRTKTVLLGSVSAIATAAAGAGNVQAATTAASTNGYTFSVQGGLALTPAEMSLVDTQSGIDYLIDKVGSGYGSSTLDDLDQAFGYNAAVTIGKDLGNGWDIRVGGTVNATGESSGYTSGYFFSSFSSNSGSSSYYSAYSGWAYAAETEKFSFQALDFEVGYSPVLTDTLNVRLFGGVRALHSLYEQGFSYGSGISGESSSANPNSGGTWDHDSGWSTAGYEGAAKTEFFGAGPRFGVDVSKRFEGTNFGISGRLAGSVLFGTQTSSYSGINYSSYYSSGASGGYSGSSGFTTSGYYSAGSSSGPYSSSYSVDKKIADVEAQIGLDYYLDDSTALTIGYQAEKFIDLDDSEDSVDHLTHGAFLKLSGSF
jgi:hypothetical protein